MRVNLNKALVNYGFCSIIKRDKRMHALSAYKDDSVSSVAAIHFNCPYNYTNVRRGKNIDLNIMSAG